MIKFFFLSLFVTSAAWANADLMGQWKSVEPFYTDPSVSINVEITFKPNSALLTSRCTFKDGAKTSATLESRVRYAPTKIQMLENLDNVTVDEDGNQCPVFSRVADINYSFKANGNLILNYVEAGYMVEMKRK